MSALSLGPILFHWTAQERRDFYFRIADEAPIERVYLGEVVCSKREPFFAPHLDEVVQRLKSAGKQVVLSTLSLITTERELELVRAICERGELVEANDLSAIQLLEGRPFVVGPFVNVLNVAALDVYARQGATRVVPAMEVTRATLQILLRHQKDLESEVMVFGRQPLAVSMRCYSARFHGLHKDTCELVCGLESDGMAADTIDGKPLYSINGTQTLSHGYLALIDRLAELETLGVGTFRLSPQRVDMVKVARIHGAVLERRISGAEGLAQLRALTTAPFINGYFRGQDGKSWVSAP